MLREYARREILRVSDQLRKLDASPDLAPGIRVALHYLALSRLEQLQAVVDAYDD